MNHTYLCLFSIGPVQKFIEQSRKTRDLFNASSLLSHIIQTTLKQLPNNTQLIYPTIKNNTNSTSSTPNRFVCKINADSLEKAQEICQKIQNILQNQTQSLLQQVRNDILKNHPTTLSYQQQTQSFLQIHYAAIPLPNHSPYTPRDYQLLNQALAATKNSKTFPQISELGRKCSVCAERNTLFYRKDSPKNFSYKTTTNLPPNIQRHLNQYHNHLQKIHKKIELLDPTEGLCALCFTKRFFQPQTNFPSTAEIALLHILSQTSNTQPYLKEYKKAFQPFDPQLLYSENLTLPYLQKYNIQILPPYNVQKIQKLQQKIQQSNHLTSYYALLLLDGDSMGKWLSGYYLQHPQNSQNYPLEPFHQAISQELQSYNQTIHKLIPKEKGKIVYAGGDDALALLNLQYLLSILPKLRTNYPNFQTLLPKLQKEDPSLTPLQCHTTSSASCGVVICHYKTPLHTALQQLRKAEKYAKNYFSKQDENKDALCLMCLKRSGETVHTVLKWNKPNLFSTLHQLQLYLQQKYLSRKFLQNLRKIFQPLIHNSPPDHINQSSAPTNPPPQIHQQLLQTELQRLLTRHKLENSTQQLTPLNPPEFSQKLLDIYQHIHQHHPNPNSHWTLPLHQFISLLEIIEFISR